MYCDMVVAGGPDDMTLLAPLEVDKAASEVVEAIELLEPRRLVDSDELPPNPVNPSVAGLDSSGKRRPVRVNFESHIR